MPFHRHTLTLLSKTSPMFTDTQTSAKQRLATSGIDNLEDASQHFGVAWHVTAAGGTSPTVDARLEGSFDNVNWYIIETMTQLVGAGARHEYKELAAKSIPPFVRAVVVPGGTAAPNTTAVVILTSSARFTGTVVK